MRMELSSENLSSGAPDPSGAFSALAAAMRPELKRHCYRMMASAADAEDCVQEALLRGWRECATLRDGASGRAWLYSIATRVCLDALRSRKRRQTLFGPSLDEAAPGSEPRSEPWVEPWVGEAGDDIRLAFVSLLHGLSPRARAVLLLHDAVGMTAAEAGEALGLSTAAARSALQRARDCLPAQAPVRIDLPVDAYVAAWNAGDLHALIGLLHGDIVMTMPPWQKTFVGIGAVEGFLRMVWPRHDGFHAVAVTANGQPGVAVYTKQGDGPYRAHSLHVLAGQGAVWELVLYAPPLGAELFKRFELSDQATG